MTTAASCWMRADVVGVAREDHVARLERLLAADRRDGGLDAELSVPRKSGRLCAWASSRTSRS